MRPRAVGDPGRSGYGSGMTDTSLPGDRQALAQLVTEVAALRDSVETMAQQLRELAQVQTRLEASESLRRDLAEQMQSVLDLLAESRAELHQLRQQKA